MTNIEKLKQFMEGRPHDRDKNIVEATIEYIEQVENKSIERYESLKNYGSMTTFDERLKDIKDFFLGDNEVTGALYDTSEVGELHPEVKEDIKWLIEQAERVEGLKRQLEQVKKAADFLLFQIGLARSISLIKAEFSGEEELYKALKEEIHFT